MAFKEIIRDFKNKDMQTDALLISQINPAMSYTGQEKSKQKEPLNIKRSRNLLSYAVNPFKLLIGIQKILTNSFIQSTRELKIQHERINNKYNGLGYRTNKEIQQEKTFEFKQ